MGKKKRPARRPAASSPRVPRKEPYSKDRMAAVIDRVKDQTVRLSGLVKSIDEAKLDAVVIDGHAMLIRGLNQIDNFIDNASRAVRGSEECEEGFVVCSWRLRVVDAGVELLRVRLHQRPRPNRRIPARGQS